MEIQQTCHMTITAYQTVPFLHMNPSGQGSQSETCCPPVVFRNVASGHGVGMRVPSSQ